MEKNSRSDESFEDNVNRHIKSVVGFCKSSKVIMLLVAGFFIILIMMAVGTFQSKDKSISSHEAEKKLAGIITQVKGIEKAEVMITYESTSKKVPATNESQGAVSPLDSGENAAQKSTKLFQTGAGQAFVITELEPEIRGVMVVARGVDDYMVKMDVINAVTTVLNISADKVEVLNMK